MKILTPVWLALCALNLETHGFSLLKKSLSTNSRQLSFCELNAAPKKQRVFGMDTSTKRKIKSFVPKSDNQKLYVEWMRNDEIDIIVAIGPAGTGKTMLACYAAVESLRLGKINKIVITRPVVSVDEEIGYLPGGISSKMDPWTRPVFDVLKETFTPKEIEQMMEDGVLEIVPLGFMRGRTFKNAWIVADEMQNSSPTQMLMLATRIGEGSKMIITGDLNQSDRPGPNGLQEISSKIQRTTKEPEYVKIVSLEMEDVQRSRAAKAILELYVEAKVEEPEPKVYEPTIEEPKSEKYSGGIQSNSGELRSQEFNTCSTKNTNCTVVEPEFEKYSGCKSGTNSGELCSQEFDGSSGEVEWVELNNDAALIPKQHYYSLPKHLRK